MFFISISREMVLDGLEADVYLRYENKCPYLELSRKVECFGSKMMFYHAIYQVFIHKCMY